MFLASVSSLLTYLPSIFEWLYIKHFIGHSRLNRTRQIVTDLDRWQTFMTLKISGIFDVFLMVSNSMRSFPPHKDSRRREANSFNFYRQHNHIIWISQFCPHIVNFGFKNSEKPKWKTFRAHELLLKFHECKIHRIINLCGLIIWAKTRYLSLLYKSQYSSSKYIWNLLFFLRYGFHPKLESTITRYYYLAVDKLVHLL